MSRGSSASYAGIIKYRDFSKKIFPLEKYETAKKKKKKEKRKRQIRSRNVLLQIKRILHEHRLICILK